MGTSTPSPVPGYYKYYNHDYPSYVYPPSAAPAMNYEVETYFDKIANFLHRMSQTKSFENVSQSAAQAKMKPAADLNIAAVLATAKLNLCVFVVLMVAYETLRLKIPSIYDGRRNHVQRSRTHRRIPARPFAWVPMVIAVPWSDLRRFGGLDAYMFLRFIRICMRVSSVSCFWALLILFPTYGTGGNNSVGFYHFSMSNVMSQSWRLWVPTIFMWLLTLHTLYVMDEEFKHFVKLRMNFLAKGDLDVDPQQRYSLLVEQIPNSLRSDRALYDYFDALFPGKVHSASVVLKVPDLEALAARRARVVRRFEKANAHLAATRERPMHVIGRARLMCCGIETLPFHGCVTASEYASMSKDENDEEEKVHGNSTSDNNGKFQRKYTDMDKGRLVDSIDYYSEELKYMNMEVAELQKQKIHLAETGAQKIKAEDWISRTLDFLTQQLGIPSAIVDHRDTDLECRARVQSGDQLDEHTDSTQYGSIVGGCGECLTDMADICGRKRFIRYHSKYDLQGSDHMDEDPHNLYRLGAQRKVTIPNVPSTSTSSSSSTSSKSCDDNEQLTRHTRLIEDDHLVDSSGEPIQPGGEDKDAKPFRRIIGRLGVDFAMNGFSFLTEQIETVVENVIVPTMSSTGFVTFNDLASVTCAASAPLCHRPDVLLCQIAPEPRDLLWKNIHVDLNICKKKETMVNILLGLGAILWSIPLTFIQAVANADTLAKIPGLHWLLDEDNEPVSGLINGYLPVIMLLLLISLLPFMFSWIANAHENRKTFSSVQASILGRYFYYQLANIYVTVTAGSLWDSVEKIIDQPTSSLDILGRALPQVVGYFISLLLTKLMAGLPIVLLRGGALFRFQFLRWTFSEDKLTQRELDEVYRRQELWYGWEYPTQLLVIVICFTYSVISPIILPIGSVYFFCALLVYKKQVLHVYTPFYESGGAMFPGACLRMLSGLICSHMTLIGYLIIRGGFLQPLVLVPLPFFTFYMTRIFTAMYDIPSRSLSLERASELDRCSHFDQNKVFRKNAFRQPVIAEEPPIVKPYRTAYPTLNTDSKGFLT